MKFSACFDALYLDLKYFGASPENCLEGMKLAKSALEQVCRIACAVGACSVESADAISGIMPFELVEQRMRAG